MSAPIGVTKRPRPFSAYISIKRLTRRVDVLEAEVANLKKMVTSLQQAERKI